MQRGLALSLVNAYLEITQGIFSIPGQSAT